MLSHESPYDPIDDSVEPHHYEPIEEYGKLEALDTTELMADIMNNVVQLIRRAEIMQAPSREASYLEFFPSDEEGQNISYIPQGLGANIDSDLPIDMIRVESDLDIGNLSGQVAVTFTYRLPNADYLTLRCAPSGGTTDVEVYALDDDRPMPGVSFPSSELVRMFASISLPNKTGDYSLFDELSLDDYETLVNFISSLSKNADFQESDSVIILHDQDKEKNVVINYSQIEGSISEVTITRLLDDGASTVYGINLNPSQLMYDDVFVYADSGFDLTIYRPDAPVEYDSGSQKALIEIYDFISQLESSVPVYNPTLMSTVQIDRLSQ